MEKTRWRRVIIISVLLLSPLASSPVMGQGPCSGSGVCIKTGQQDTVSDIVSGYAYRTGENLNESIVTSSSITTDSFGQLCSTDTANLTPLDGQIYAQPLVLTYALLPRNRTAKSIPGNVVLA